MRPAKPELISLFIILLQNDYRCLSVKWKTTNEGTSVTRLTSSETEKNERTKMCDYVYNYACVRLSMGLFVQNFDDAVREGDGSVPF